MNDTINGLHSCRPGNEPKEGDVKTFVIEQKMSKGGKPWLKIKSAGTDFGGTPHRILSAEKTDFVDAHGNISFNLEIEPAKGSAPPMRQDAPRTARTTEEWVSVPPDVDGARRRIMQIANLLLLCKRAADTVLKEPDPEDGRTIMIQACREGLLNAMPADRMIETRQTAEPFPTDVPQIPEGDQVPW